MLLNIIIFIWHILFNIQNKYLYIYFFFFKRKKKKKKKKVHLDKNQRFTLYFKEILNKLSIFFINIYLFFFLKYFYKLIINNRN